MRFKAGTGDWRQYRALKGLVELDLHHEERRAHDLPYDEAMARARERVLDALKRAQQAGHRFLMVKHGHSTPAPGKQTQRSVVRALLRHADATPFIERSECIQHEAVFVAAIRGSVPTSIPTNVT